MNQGNKKRGKERRRIERSTSWRKIWTDRGVAVKAGSTEGRKNQRLATVRCTPATPEEIETNEPGDAHIVQEGWK